MFLCYFKIRCLRKSRHIILKCSQKLSKIRYMLVDFRRTLDKFWMDFRSGIMFGPFWHQVTSLFQKRIIFASIFDLASIILNYTLSLN